LNIKQARCGKRVGGHFLTLTYGVDYALLVLLLRCGRFYGVEAGLKLRLESRET